MRFKLYKKYFSILFIVAMIMGAFHHHHDLKEHIDCKICVIQSNLTDIDTPIKTIYFTKLDVLSEPIALKPKTLIFKQQQNHYKPRSPPKIS